MSGRLQSPATRLFIRQLVPANVKEYTKALHLWVSHRSRVGSPQNGPQRVSKAEIVSISWRIHKSSPTVNVELHDDVIKWKHFPRNGPFVRGIHRSPVNSPHKGQWRGALMFSLICVWINGWVNNHESGDLRRYRAHCDVTVMNHSHITSNSHVCSTFFGPTAKNTKALKPCIAGYL